MQVASPVDAVCHRGLRGCKESTQEYPKALGHGEVAAELTQANKLGSFKKIVGCSLMWTMWGDVKCNFNRSWAIS